MPPVTPAGYDVSGQRTELDRWARAEGVSLNQLIVYQLARMTTAADLEDQKSMPGAPPPWSLPPAPTLTPP